MAKSSLSSAISEIKVVNFFKGIGILLLSGCSNLKEVTLPIRNEIFSYLFDVEMPSNSTFLPASLQKVTINDGNDYAVIEKHLIFER